MAPSKISTRLRRSVKRVVSRRTDTSSAKAPERWDEWAIGIYVGASPLEVGARDGDNPVLTRESVSDVRAASVADPFMVRVGGTWHMFFEVLNKASGKGEIGLATSGDGKSWTYREIVLREPFHLSYPYVFEWMGECYMVPESHETKSVRLYRAVDFPRKWSFVKTLIAGRDYVDPSVFVCDGSWWLLCSGGTAPFRADDLHLFCSKQLTGPWAEHPRSPIVRGDRRVARPAGRVLVRHDGIIRFAQDCSVSYGERVRAIRILELTAASYREQEESATAALAASGGGWNAAGMHHIDAHPMDDGSWIACVDGFAWVAGDSEANGRAN